MYKRQEYMGYTTQTSTARIKKVCGGRGWWVCCFNSTTYRAGLSHRKSSTRHKLQPHALKRCVAAAVGGFVVSTAPPTEEKYCTSTQMKGGKHTHNTEHACAPPAARAVPPTGRHLTVLTQTQIEVVAYINALVVLLLLLLLWQ